MNARPCALVTGASRGIGRAVVELLLERGRDVLASARDEQALRELERAHPGRVTALPCDLAQLGAAEHLVEHAFAYPVREVVLAAGIVRYEDVDEISEASLREQLELNFVASFLILLRAGIRLRSPGGSMVAIASTLATHHAPRTAAYAASKAALISAARSLALELAPSVRLNVIAPGVVDTEMIRAPRGGDTSSGVAEQLEALRSLHPLGRLGSARDVAGAALYLLEAPWVTGSVLTVDGGLTLA